MVFFEITGIFKRTVLHPLQAPLPVSESVLFRLPLLIVMIMAVMVNYINHFIIRQRAKEFATYMLLGMEKDKLSLVFLIELSVIGLVCFLLCAALGTGIFSACCVEILSIFFMKRKIYKLQIVELIREKQRKQPLDADNKTFWS